MLGLEQFVALFAQARFLTEPDEIRSDLVDVEHVEVEVRGDDGSGYQVEDVRAQLRAARTLVRGAVCALDLRGCLSFLGRKAEQVEQHLASPN